MRMFLFDSHIPSTIKKYIYVETLFAYLVNIDWLWRGRETVTTLNKLALLVLRNANNLVSHPHLSYYYNHSSTLYTLHYHMHNLYQV